MNNKINNIDSKIDMTLGLKEFELPKCDNYRYNIIDFLIPPITTFTKLCKSTDKTYLFMISFARLALFIIITKLYYDLYVENNNFDLIFEVLSFYSIINAIILMYVISKNQIYPKK